VRIEKLGLIFGSERQICGGETIKTAAENVGVFQETG
jgi:hypothetical protein